MVKSAVLKDYEWYQRPIGRSLETARKVMPRPMLSLLVLKRHYLTVGAPPRKLKMILVD